MNPVSTTVVTNPLQALNALGQSIWLDYIRRSLITSGDLQRLIREDGLRGITSNPAIFEKAIGGSTDYNDSLKALQQEADYDAQALYERLAIADIQAAADTLRSVYDATKSTGVAAHATVLGILEDWARARRLLAQAAKRIASGAGRAKGAPLAKAAARVRMAVAIVNERILTPPNGSRFSCRPAETYREAA